MDEKLQENVICQPECYNEIKGNISHITSSFIKIYNEDRGAQSVVGVTKAPLLNFSISKIFDLAKVPLRLFESHFYLTDATAGELQQNLSNINVMLNR